MADADYFERLEAFATRLKPDAAQMDESVAAVAAWYDRFQQEELNLGGSVRMPFEGLGFCRALETLAMVSGAFAFVAMQQFVANMNLGDRFQDSLWPKVGVAFGHLGARGHDLPQRREGTVNGFAPWLTGAGIFDWVVLGVYGEEQEEIFVLTEARDRLEFAHTEPISLMACAGSCTVGVHMKNLLVSDDSILKIDPPGSKARSDAETVLYQIPLLVGCVRASWEIIAASPRVDNDQKAACGQHTKSLLDRAHTAFANGDMGEGPALRAELGDYAVRIARLAAMATGGGGLRLSHPVQRLYREALVYSLMAQTDLIIHQAFSMVIGGPDVMAG